MLGEKKCQLLKPKMLICNMNERLKILLNILTKSLLLCCSSQDAVLS
jgi:anti-anti-sigma regulatory factor